MTAEAVLEQARESTRIELKFEPPGARGEMSPEEQELAREAVEHALEFSDLLERFGVEGITDPVRLIQDNEGLRKEQKWADHRQGSREHQIRIDTRFLQQRLGNRASIIGHELDHALEAQTNRFPSHTSPSKDPRVEFRGLRFETRNVGRLGTGPGLDGANQLRLRELRRSLSR